MINREHQLIVRYIPTRNNTLKMFALYSPINLEEFAPLALYRELSVSDDQFAIDVLMALKDAKSGKQKFLDKLVKHWEVIPNMFDLNNQLKTALYFLNHLEKELTLFNLYQDGILLFNSMWIEGPDSLVFFRVDKNDL